MTKLLSRLITRPNNNYISNRIHAMLIVILWYHAGQESQCTHTHLERFSQMCLTPCSSFVQVPTGTRHLNKHLQNQVDLPTSDCIILIHTHELKDEGCLKLKITFPFDLVRP